VCVCVWVWGVCGVCVYFSAFTILAQNAGDAEFEVTNPQIKHYRLTPGISVLFISSL